MKQTIAMLALPLAAIAIGLIAQTRAPITQVATPGGPVAVLAIRANGSLVWARLAGGLSLVENIDGSAAIIATAAPPVSRSRTVIGESLRFDAASHQATLRNTPADGTLAVFRNGLRQVEGVDYTRAGAVLTDVAYYVAVQPYDSVAALTVDYQVVQP